MIEYDASPTYLRFNHPYYMAGFHFNMMYHCEHIHDGYFYNAFISKHYKEYNIIDYCKKIVRNKHHIETTIARLHFAGNGSKCILGIVPFHKKKKELTGDVYINVYGMYEYRESMDDISYLFDFIFDKLRHTYKNNIHRIILKDYSNHIHYPSYGSMKHLYFMIHGFYYYVHKYHFELYNKRMNRKELNEILHKQCQSYQDINMITLTLLKSCKKLWKKMQYSANTNEMKEMKYVFSILPSYRCISDFMQSYVFVHFHVYDTFLKILKTIMNISYCKSYDFICYL
jgi:hypothetical protein